MSIQPTEITGTVRAGTQIGGSVADGAQIRGNIISGPMIINDWAITVEQIDGGHMLIARRGTEIQSMPIMDGRDAFMSVSDDGKGNVIINGPVKE